MCIIHGIYVCVCNAHNTMYGVCKNVGAHYTWPNTLVMRTEASSFPGALTLELADRCFLVFSSVSTTFPETVDFIKPHVIVLSCQEWLCDLLFNYLLSLTFWSSNHEKYVFCQKSSEIHHLYLNLDVWFLEKPEWSGGLFVGLNDFSQPRNWGSVTYVQHKTRDLEAA